MPRCVWMDTCTVCFLVCGHACILIIVVVQCCCRYGIITRKKPFSKKNGQTRKDNDPSIVYSPSIKKQQQIINGNASYRTSGRPDVVFLGLRSRPAQQATGLLFSSPIYATDNFPSMLVPVFTVPPPLITASTRARGGRRKIQAAIDPLPSKLPTPSALCVIVAATPYLIH